MQALIRLALAHRVVVALLALLVMAYGLVALTRAPLDVFPEFVPPQVSVQTEASGFSPEQVEQLVTRQVESSVSGAPGLESMRSESIPGLSVVTLSFRENIDQIAVRQGVAENLAELSGHLPVGVDAPKMSPMTSSTMDLLKVGLLSDKLDGYALRDLADWTIKPRLLSVPGVARVTVYGGEVRQLQIQLKPERLQALHVSVREVLDAARSATSARGGGLIDLAGQRISVSASAGVQNATQLGLTVIRRENGVSVRIRDVAEVREDAMQKFGDAIVQGRPGVLIAISGQYGVNTLDATRAAEAAINELAPQLKKQGVSLVSPLHRPANFIELAVRDLGHALILGSILILVLLLIFLRNWRTALISFITIPLSLLAAIIVLNANGQTLNTMTLGGFAVALGVLVDDAIIDIENIIRRLRLNAKEAKPKVFLDVILQASLEIRSSVFYATLVVLLVFLPILAMSGVQGRLLAPMAEAFVLAVLASLLVALTVTPALCALILRPDEDEHEPQWLEKLRTMHQSALQWADRYLRLSALVLFITFIASLAVLPFLGGEFFPMFREGHFVLQVSGQPGTSMDDLLRAGRNMSTEIMKLPSVAAVEQQAGRAEQGEDTWGSHRSEFHIELKPDSQVDQSEVQDQLREIVGHYPALQSEVLTFLGDRISETLSGETAQVVVNVVGPDLDQLDASAKKVFDVAKTIPGIVDLKLASQSGAPEIHVALDAEKMSRTGVRPADAMETLGTAYAGEIVGQLYQQDRVLNVVTILPKALRERPESLSHLMLDSTDGRQIPLSTVATITTGTGRYSIKHESGRRQVAVTFNVSGRSATAITDELRSKISQSIVLPARSFVEFSGVAEAEQAARRELWLYSLVALIFILICLGMAFRQRVHVPLVLLNLPFALIGGIAAIAISGIGLSIGSLVGLVTVFGISARNAILLLAHYEHLVEVEGAQWSSDTAWRGAAERLRPVLMTALVTALGLVPLAWGLGKAGHEIEAPMAIAVLGGLVSSTFLTLVLLPVIARRYAFQKHNS
jgi:CzcA family heavy metal efflux pump